MPANALEFGGGAPAVALGALLQVAARAATYQRICRD